MRAGPFWSGGGSVLLLVWRAKPSLRVGNWRVGFQTTNFESRVTSDTAQYGYVLRALVVRRRRAPVTQPGARETWHPLPRRGRGCARPLGASDAKRWRRSPTRRSVGPDSQVRSVAPS